MGIVRLKGNLVVYDACVNLMDNDIREGLHNDMSPCADQEFLDAYRKAHEEKFDEEFTI